MGALSSIFSMNISLTSLMIVLYLLDLSINRYERLNVDRSVPEEMSDDR